MWRRVRTSALLWTLRVCRLKAAGGTRAFSFCLKLEGTENLEFDGSSSDNFGFFTDGEILTQTDAQADGMGGNEQSQATSCLAEKGVWWSVNAVTRPAETAGADKGDSD